jgi:hypothetical protein
MVSRSGMISGKEWISDLSRESSRRQEEREQDETHGR